MRLIDFDLSNCVPTGTTADGKAAKSLPKPAWQYILAFLASETGCMEISDYVIGNFKALIEQIPLL